MARTKRAVLLLNLGGAGSLDEIGPFLVRLFSDRDIIQLPGGSLLQPLFARLIALLRAPKVRPHYAAIGGGSPILAHTLAQARALEATSGLRCFVGMRYSEPTIEEALAGAIHAEVDEAVALPLFPHYSRATTGSVYGELDRAVKKLGAAMPIRRVRDFPDQPNYLAALAETIEEGLSQFKPEERKDVRVIFSAHSLPQSFVDAGDPYVEQVKRTIAGLERVMDLPKGKNLCFQSRSGPVKWLEPETEATLDRLISEGCRRMLMVPISFVSDHLETLYEMDMLYRRKAECAGVRFVRAPALNDRARFIEAMAELVGSG